MNENDSVLPLARRSFLTHVGAGATILGASIAATGAPPPALNPYRVLAGKQHGTKRTNG